MHGSYNYVTERPLNLFTSIADLNVLHESEKYVAIQFELKTGEQYQFAFSLDDDDASSSHNIGVGNTQLDWTGVYNFREIKE